MLGWRGASRYYDERYREGFALECQAAKKARDQMGLRNVKIMVPFRRTLDEAPLVASEIARHGLSRHDNGLDLYMMVETPANVLQIGDVAAHFDGFSIGSNDLTQLTLGVDRDSSLVARAFDERHPAVRSLIQQAIQGAHRARRTIGLCGQAPSDYPDFARFLVECGIDSISLNPDSMLSTIPIVLAAEAGRSAASTSHQAARASA
jgi:pyruvate,water dikinase